MVSQFENDNGSDFGGELDTLPHSWEAEQALLGALLYDNEIYHRVSGIVQAKHFYNPVNGRIFEQTSKLIELGQLADAIVLKDRFSQDETIEDIGGVEYLARLLANAPAAASMAAPEYARLIFDHAMRRELIKLGEEINLAAKDVSGENTATSLIGDAENKLFSLAEAGDAQGGFETFSQALIKSINMASAAFSRDGHLSGTSTPFYIDDTGGISIGQLSARARRLKRMAGLDLIIVDYLQLLSGGSALKSSDGRVQEITMITMGLKALAKELDVPVLALAQLSRQVEQRDDKRPQLSDLRESGSIEQDADVVSFVFREEYYVARSDSSGYETPSQF